MIRRAFFLSGRLVIVFGLGVGYGSRSPCVDQGPSSASGPAGSQCLAYVHAAGCSVWLAKPYWLR